MPGLILIPGDPGFDEILYTSPPPDVKPTDNNFCYVVGADGIPRSITGDRELEDFLYGGEYDLMMQTYGEPEDWELEEW
ncbi:hypothetical protein IQ219_00745 [Synechocystis sp. LEGE 06083]|uniref:hypothetical protein n=1 Tax=Synechocystis sp. LEGE 06083 TaxID=915336 RepID=UPI0018818FAF|nr:hypothetical protein [Synechocystis sp. LEGE 06083]MBE9193885.1 hypothetical protein [Synechocystis sp. LEGE 06083]